ncbi:MAG: cytochrome C [Gammaproteobacteria bacterium]
MTAPRVRVYLDGNPEPIIDHELPTNVTLDTRELADGPHRLVVRAEGQQGIEGVEEIPFNVHNGPGIVVSGLRRNSTRRGNVHFTIDAFSADDPFDPRRAEARSSIPVWVWVLSLFVVSWAVWYGARMWDVPSEFADTPTYRSNQTSPLEGVDAGADPKPGDGLRDTQ